MERRPLVRVEVLAVGRELLIGRTLNTNVQWMGRRLALMGSMIKEITTVDDDLDEISDALKGILSRSPDFLVVVGGLGPTPDDMTLKGIARGLGRRMALNEDAMTLMKTHYAKRGMADVELTPARRKMAILPSGATPVINEPGTAPGVRLESGRTVMFCLPGVPAEMEDIFGRSVEPEIGKKVGKLNRKTVTLKIEGLFESTMAPLIERELERHPGTYIKSHPLGIKEGRSRIELDIVAVGEKKADVEKTSMAVVEEMTKLAREAGGVVKPVRGRA